jgi:N-acetyl sugar amidotransferase
MPFTGQVCTRGVWDESIPKIRFDSAGVSNYARLFDSLVVAYPRGEKGEADWNKIVGKIKAAGKNKKHDCIIGVSGGTDSSYLLYLAKELGLRPLAVNLDNGWNSDIAVRNIKKMTDALCIDLETYVVNYEEIKDLIKSYMYAGLPWIDMPTDLAIKGVLYKVANREGIKYILRGNDFRSEGSQPTEWTYGDGRQLSHLHRKFGKVRLKTFPNYTMSNLIYYGFIRKIKSIYPFYYLDYNKKKAQEFLTEKYGWEYYGGHHYENIFTKFVMSYWTFSKYGIDKRKITLSAQVLSGEISRDAAVEEIGKLPYDTGKLEATLDYISKKLDLSRNELNRIMKSPNTSYKDFPSYSAIFSTMNKFAIPVLKLILVHKPQSLFQAEMRNEKK